MKYIIVFHDGSTKETTKERAEYLMEKSCEPNSIGANIDGSFIRYSSISKILTESEYYNQYPDKIPPQYTSKEERNDHLLKDDTNRILSNINSKEKRIRAVEQMMKGLKKYIESPANKKTGKPEKLLKTMERKLAILNGGQEEMVMAGRKKEYNREIEKISDPAERAKVRESAWL